MSLSFRKTVLPALLVLAAIPASAAEWSAQPSVVSEVYYDSNIVMGSGTRVEEVEGLRLTPRLNLRGRSAIWQTNLNISLPFNRLSNDLYDSDDQIVGLDYTRNGERQAWGLSGELRRQSTRTAVAELGFVAAATRTENRSLRPYWTWIANENNSLQVGGNWLEAEYSSPRFSDYEQYSFDVTWIRVLGERLTLQSAVYSSSFDLIDPRQTDSDTVGDADSTGLSITLLRQFDEKLSGSIGFGARRTETLAARFLPADQQSIFCLLFGFGCLQELFTDESDGFTGSAQLGYEGDTWQVSLAASRSLTPDAFAQELVETDQIEATYSRQLREKLFFDMSLEYVSSESLGDSAFSREYWYATPALRWRFAERWTFSTTLRHRIREATFGFSGVDTDSTAIFFRVHYTHPRASW
ncbi:MAG: hypothetical protein HKO55_05700 [Gammaproteobacteria bacterium]|nr:hypothetical protein [Gammaproteobacteria bacterium]NNM20747.1 hypothetical protein [Gammaproteobacteria bacterium]